MIDLKDVLSAIPNPLQKLVRSNMNLFPLKKGTKLPAHKGWQQEAAHALSDQITFWYNNHGSYNVGLATGCYMDPQHITKDTTGLLVLDFDKGKGGLKVLKELLLKLPVTFTVKTREDGYHLYYLYPAALKVGNRTGWMQGVDIRAQGGYVVAPGSKVPKDDGSPGFYTAQNANLIAKAPVWLLKDLMEPKVKKPQHSAEDQ